MSLTIRVLLFPIFVAIGIICLITSIPFMIVGLLVVLGFGYDVADWFFEYSPLTLWMSFVENLNRRK